MTRLWSPAAVLSGLLGLASKALAQSQALIHDSASADSIRFDQAPLPGGAAAVFRFLFSGVPQWIQIGGVFVGAITAVVVATLAWKHRQAIITWLLTRSRGAKIALGASTVLTLGVAGGAGAWSWNFMMHDNDFCSSCHVMKGAFTKFRVSEHDKLECHACHQQSILASTKELYYWVLDRPEKIPAHAPVPNRVCGECHEQKQADSTWKRVIATAGHSVHFKSDSSQLRNLMCVDCHAKEVHAFKAVDMTCTTSNCHEQTKVRLGGMANQSGLHCVTCHDFGRSVSEVVPIDSSRQALVPARQECFSCHEMREKLEKHGLDKDPHKATCGTCHNPHDQVKAGKAFDSCATAGCHASADTLTAYHRGLGAHKLDQCGACHKPHSWKVESTRCIDCHSDIYRDNRPGRGRVRSTEAAPAPAGETALVLPTRTRLPGGPHAEGPDDDSGASMIRAPRPPPTAAGADTTFAHGRHRKVACTTCHSTSSTHGALTIKAPRDCQGCHHAADARAGECAACHSTSELTATQSVATAIRVTGRAPTAPRQLPFAHVRHARLACGECHVAGDPARQKADCSSCHTDHHRAEATCASCHGDARGTHTREVHEGCASCHRGAGTAALPPSREVCLACHPAQREHKPAQRCEVCHRAGWGAAHGSDA